MVNEIFWSFFGRCRGTVDISLTCIVHLYVELGVFDTIEDNRLSTCFINRFSHFRISLNHGVMTWLPAVTQLRYSKKYSTSIYDLVITNTSGSKIVKP